MRTVLFFVFTVLLGSAAPTFIPPDETYPLIDRGKIPLDVTAISALADDLATIADRPTAASPEGLRNQAMLIALAQRLSPAQEIAREVRLGLLAGNFTTSRSQKERNLARTRLFDITPWLLEQPTESTSHLLGQQLLDILLFLQPKHRLAAKHDAAGASHRWHGVIAPLEKFGSSKPRPKISRPLPAPPSPEPDQINPPYLITEFEIQTPLIGQHALLEPSLNLAPLSLKIQQRGGSKLQIKPNLPREIANDLHHQILEFFETQKRPLPPKYQLQLSTGELSYHRHNETNIIAPLAMMLDSALTGKPLRDNIILFANLKRDGSFTRPSKSWELMQSLRKSRPAPGTRLLVAPELEEEMMGFLVQGDAAFLLRYEIISCRNISEARELYLSNEKIPETLSDAANIFRAVVEKARPRMNDLNAFLAYESVKKRLASAVRANPRHLSAKVLSLQASGNRPSQFSSKIFAMEYHRFISTLVKEKRPQLNEIAQVLKSLQIQKRREWREISDSRLVSREHEAIFNDGLKLIDELGPIARGYQDENRNQNSNPDYDLWQLRVQKLLELLEQQASR